MLTLFVRKLKVAETAGIYSPEPVSTLSGNSSFALSGINL